MRRIAFSLQAVEAQLDYEGSTAARLLVGFGAGHPWIMVRGQLIDTANARPVLRFLAKRGYEGMDTWWGDEAVLRDRVRDLAVDVSEVIGRVREHKPLK